MAERAYGKGWLNYPQKCDTSETNIEATARIAYERWVEGNDGMFMGRGLPPWTSSKHPDSELPEEQKRLWVKVACIPYMAGYEAAMVVAQQVDVATAKHPEETPEYEKFRAALREELIKFAAGEEPYSYGLDRVNRD